MPVMGTASRTGGVPTFTVEAPGPRRAVLAFRVGRADEGLPMAGITHLVEHLALLPFQEQPYQYGGAVEGARTIFWVQGSDAEIAEFFRKLSENLAGLPLDRLADQARLLETEARSRKTSALQSLLSIRYGTSGWGTTAFPEYGLMRPDPEYMREWGERWFTAGNAALGLSGAVDGLTLQLRSGSRMPSPELTPVASLHTPAWMHERQAGVGIGFVGPRSIQFAGLMRSLARHGRARLRFSESLSYEVAENTMRLSDRVAHGILWADGLQENMSKVWTGLLAVIDQVRAEGPTETELREDVAMLRKTVEHPSWPLVVMDRLITDELFGVPTETTDDLIATLERSTPADYQALVDEVFPTALALVPDGVAILDARFTPVPIWSQHAAQGREYRLQAPRTALQGQMTRLAVGDSAISLTFGVGQVVNVAFDECQVALAWDDGSRTLISRDSFRLHIRPADWTGGAEMLKALDARLPKNRVVPMGPRPNPDPESLSGAMAPAARPTRRRWTFNWRRAVIAGTMLIAFYVLAAILRVALGGH